jgi:RNA polymerase sigma factor (sigma-70 family)
VAIQDGFGDDRRDIDYREYLLSNERLLKIKVAERMRGNSSSSDIYQDLLNEGRIVQWEVLEKRPDAPREYVSAAMTNRIMECIRRGTWTGLERTHGKPVDPLRRPLHERESTDDPDVDVVVSSGDWADGIQMAYHHGQIMQALNLLTFTQKLAVYRRFWEGLSNEEIAARQGCSKQTVERQWRTEIRPALLQQLGHLSPSM